MIPPAVAEVCATFLRAAPAGLVTGLHLRGGVALGEWVPGQSDVDFVATLAHRPGPAEVAALRTAHEEVARAHPDVALDGPHVLAADLATDPRGLPDVPTVLGHHFTDEDAIHDGVVAWHELALAGVTVLGPPVSELGVWTAPEALRAFTRDNLDTYWRASADALAAMPSEGEPERACCWCVLGVARLHHLLVTGAMTTKSAAGRWALTAYPDRFHRVLREALRIRHAGDIHAGARSEYEDEPGARGRDTAELTAWVVARGTEG